MTDPFPLLFQALAKAPESPGPKTPDATTTRAADLDDGVLPLFEASVRGVQSRFPHLSEADIVSPPHHWFDAALARQIALHLLVEHFDVPKRAVAKELERSRDMVNRALRTIDERLQYPEFQDTYSAIAESARAALNKEESE
ncbi:hypothetical protein [Flavimaribacter sediminis]|uniref:hypothetical protein n=1 Tax=Flavimaribacter sediminis TaxID=2865987 RepID=UPI00215D7EBA|nr:hypothetical protein [Flavimaribacter sediminis]